MHGIKFLTAEDRAGIVKNWHEAKYKLKQIKVLADLYDVSVYVIKQVLIYDAGCKPEELDMRKPNKVERTPAEPAQKKSRMTGILAALRDERAYLETQTKELPEMIAKLTRELEGIAAKMAAIDQSIELLRGMEGIQDG